MSKFLIIYLSNFCGFCVCDNHSKKNRLNPENNKTKEFLKCCDFCDKKYIMCMLFKEYEKEKIKKENLTEKLIKEKDEIKEKNKILNFKFFEVIFIF